MPLSVNQIKQLVLSTSNDSLQTLLDVLFTNIHKKENEEATIFAINSLLLNSKTRIKGLELVAAIIPYLSANLLGENVLAWANYCKVNHANETTKEIKFKTLGRIIESSRDVDNFNKKFIADHLSDTLKACLGFASSTSERVAALKCLSECMKCYQSWFGNHKSKVEPFLLKFVESGTESEVKEAAIAFHYLHQTGGAGVEGINYVNNYSLNLKKLCATAHFLYDEFFESVNEIENADRVDADAFVLSPLSSHLDSQQSLEAICARLTNCITFIRTMIAKKYPVMKKITPKYIIDVVTRGLSLHVCSTSLKQSDISMGTQILGLLLNKIQEQLLLLLRVFLVGYVSCVLPYAHPMTKVLVNTLKRTQGCHCFDGDNSYKKAVYQTFINWLAFTKIAVSDVHVQETLIPILMQSIAPPEKKVTLNLSAAKKKGKGNKKSPVVATINSCPTSTKEESMHIIGPLLKEDAAVYALDVLNCLLSMSDLSKVKPPIIQEVNSFIVKTLGDVQAGRSSSPYTNPCAQLKLYQALISLYQQDNLALLPPVHLAIYLLNKGLMRTNHNIVHTCVQGLELLEKISQPVCPSLNFVVANNSDGVNSTKTVIESIDLVDLNDSERLVVQLMNEDEEVINLDDLELGPVNNDKIIVLSETVLNGTTNGIIELAEKEENVNTKKSEIIEILDESFEQLPVETKMNGNKIIGNTEEITEEPAAKKQKHNDDTNSAELEEMFSSFQDVLQN